jgi:AcrR family transcriptional regulator
MAMTTAETRETAGPAPLTGTARERLLAAASELFYREGIHTVGIDRVIERAGVAKASLYNTFGSKDELIRAYLEQRRARTEVRVNTAIEKWSTPREKLLAIYAAQGAYIERSHFRGCAFMNASAETQPGSTVEQTSDEFRAWFRSLFRQLAVDGGAADPDALAARLVLIYDGAAMSARMDRNPAVFADAQALAGMAFDAAIGAGVAARA